MIPNEIIVDLAFLFAADMRDLHRVGLEMRHTFGMALRVALDPSLGPTFDWDSLSELGRMAGIPVIDLRRMKNFATRFDSVEEFESRYPTLLTWAQVAPVLE